MTRKRKINSQSYMDSIQLATGSSSILGNVFVKSFHFQKDKEWALFPGTQFFSSESWLISKLQELKKRSNDIKGLLNNINLNDWDEHTDFTHLTGGLRYFFKRCRPELMTQAWLKFTEIVYNFPIIPRKNTLRTLHLCEAPGAFVSALNHYLANHCKENLEWHWRANSLNPYYEGNSSCEMIADDRLIRDTRELWIFGSDNTGDVFSSFVQQEIISRSENIDLVTADGSVDCQMNPGEQEAMVAPLHYCEAFLALQVLNSGGSLVLKMFTFFETSSICLLYLLNNLFVKVNIFKPATSKPGNSEVYVVCINYQRDEEIVAQITKHIKNLKTIDFNKTSLFSEDAIPVSFLNQLIDCSSTFTVYQTTTILKNVDLFHNMTPEKRDEINRLKQLAIREFKRKFPIQVLLDQQKLIKKTIFTKLFFGKHFSSQNQEEREKIAVAPWDEQVVKILDIVKMMKSTVAEETCQQNFLNCLKLKLQDAKLDWSQMNTNKPIMGKPFQRIMSSKFCEDLLLKYWNKLQDNIQYTLGQRSDLLIPSIVLNKIFYYLDGTGTRNVIIDVVRTGILDVQILIEFLKSKGLLIMNLEDTLLCQHQESNSILSKRRIIFIDCIEKDCDNNQKEINSHFHLLNTFGGKYFRDMDESDLLVFHLSTLFTRISISFIYLLYQTFEEIYIIPAPHLGQGQMYHYVIATQAKTTDLQQMTDFIQHQESLIQRDSQVEVMEIFSFITVLKAYSFCSQLKTHIMQWLLSAMEDIIIQEIEFLKQQSR